jgi:hypothetical protein
VCIQANSSPFSHLILLLRHEHALRSETLHPSPPPPLCCV